MFAIKFDVPDAFLASAIAEVTAGSEFTLGWEGPPASPQELAAALGAAVGGAVTLHGWDSCGDDDLEGLLRRNKIRSYFWYESDDTPPHVEYSDGERSWSWPSNESCQPCVPMTISAVAFEESAKAARAAYEFWCEGSAEQDQEGGE